MFNVKLKLKFPMKCKRLSRRYCLSTDTIFWDDSGVTLFVKGVTSELGDRQSSHPVKTLLQYYGKSLEALPGVAYPGFRDNRSTLNTKTGFLKKSAEAVARHDVVHLL